LLFGAIAFAHADTLPIPDPDLAAANSVDLCADSLGPCDGLSNFAPVVPSAHPHNHLTHHRLAKRRPPAIAARQEVVAENSFQTGGLTCAGANAWSLLCPGAQLIGISY
jgi:hypothetical protein